jgi:poly(hydroxyalkanoate) depolymerase family esterase
VTFLLAVALWVTGSFSNDAGTRAFRLYVPSGYVAGEKRPLLVFIHGCTETAEEFAGLSRIADLAERERVLVLMPAQSTSANSSRCWNWFMPENQKRGSGEPSIIRGMIDWTRERYSVDMSRVYVAGVSSGGFMTSVMLSCYADVFAAGMVASGGMYKAAGDVYSGAYAALYGSLENPNETGTDAWKCSGSLHPRPVPVLVFHGNLDPYVARVNADLTISQFAQLNDLADDGIDNGSITNTPLSTTTTPFGQLTCTRKTYLFGEQRVVNGMGHSWSGGDPSFAYADTRGFDETAIMWEFLSQYSRAIPRRRVVEK